MIKLSPTLEIPPREFASQGNAILGIRDSGKTVSATFLAEQLLIAKIPIIAFDPIGVWKNLKVRGTGEGFPVVVAAVQGGDLTLTKDSAPEIVRAAMREGVSLVIDLFDMHLSKADWKKIVGDCIRVLLYENKPCGLRHIFIEEAAEFVPQNIQNGDGVVYAEIEKLARMGGNSSLGYTLINQRAEQINKAVLELCDCMFLHRQKGKNSLTSLGKWLDFADREKSKEIIGSLPGLQQGQCWVWPQGSNIPVLVKMPMKRTFHPDRRNPEIAAPKATKDVSAFVGSMTKLLPILAAEKDAKDPAKLQKEIKRLEAIVSAGGAPDQKALDDARTEGFRESQRKGMGILRQLQAGLLHVMESAKEVHDSIQPFLDNVEAPQASFPRQKVIHRPAAQPARTVQSSAFSDGEKLPVGNQAVLKVCAHYIEGATREQITLYTDYKKSSRNAYIQRLLQAGLVELNGELVRATQAGINALGTDYEPLPTGRALQAYWIERLPEGEKRILALLLSAHPDTVSRDDLSDSTGYKKSSRNAYLQRLKVRHLVVLVGNNVGANDNLF